MEHIILHETAKLAKEAGFDRLTEMSYDGVGTLVNERWNKFASHPSFSPCCYQDELSNWLLEKKQIFIDISFNEGVWSAYIGEFTLPNFKPSKQVFLEEQESFEKTLQGYHSIKEMGIQEALEMVMKQS